MNQQPYTSDEIIISDLIRQLLKKWKTIVFFTLAGLLIGVLLAVFLPSKYQSVGVLQGAQIGVPKQVSDSETGVPSSSLPLESPDVVLARLTSRNFAEEVTQALLQKKLINPDDKNVWVKKLLYTAKKDKNSNLIELTVLAHTPQQSVDIVNTIVSVLQQKQLSQYSERIRQEQEKISLLKQQQMQIEEQYRNAHNNLTFSSDKSTVYLELARISDAGTFFKLKKQILDMEIALTPPITHPSQLIEQVAVDNKPISPKVGLLISLGIIVGLLMGCTYVLMSDAWRKHTPNQ